MIIIDKKYVDQRNNEYKEKMLTHIEFVKNEIRNTQYIPDNRKPELLNRLKSGKVDYSYISLFDLLIFEKEFSSDWKIEKYIEIREWSKSLKLYDIRSYFEDGSPYDYILDSEPKFFDGDILITDPCYVKKRNLGEETEWDIGIYKGDLRKLGITNFMERDTIYGDWICGAFNLLTKEQIGTFCADSGRVGVFLLDEIIRYNSKPIFYENNNECFATIIKDFKGTIQFIVRREETVYNFTTRYHKKGEKRELFELEIHGTGINKVTGKPYHFVTKQIGI